MLQGIQRQRGPAAWPLLAPGMRRWAALLAAGCVAVTAWLALAFGHQRRPGRLDAAVDTRIHGLLGSYQGPLHQLSRLGGLFSVAELTAALVLACLVTRRWRGAVLAALAVPAAMTLTEFVLKPLVGRSISGYDSFPSGHATAMFALAASCAVLLANPRRPRLPRPRTARPPRTRRRCAPVVYLDSVSRPTTRPKEISPLARTGRRRPAIATRWTTMR